MNGNAKSIITQIDDLSIDDKNFLSSSDPLSISPKREVSSLGLSDWTYLTAAPETEQTGPPKITPRKDKINLRKFIGAVRGVEIYDTTVVTKRYGGNHPGSGGKRRKIFNLSSKSLARLAFIAFNTSAHFPSLMTLTYADVLTDGTTVKRDLDVFLKWYRRNFPGELYLWWLEFQKRGAPHFHILTTLDLSQYGRLTTIHRKNGDTWQTNWDMWQMLESTWAGGMTAWEVVNDAEGGKKYAAKYATKSYQKAVPESYRDVGRFWGHSRDGVKPEPKAFYECSERQLRTALEVGGWEHLPDDGELIFRELYQAASAIDVTKLRQVQELPETPATAEDDISRVTGQRVNGDALKVGKHDALGKAGDGVYTCRSCGLVYLNWQGQCSDCGEWNTLKLFE